MNSSELDLLADYVEGLLAGSPEHERVAELVANDPAWSDAYAQLTAANPIITAALSELADPPIPPSVSADLRTAFAHGDAEPDVLAAPTPLRRREDPERGPAFRIAGWVAAAAVVAFAVIGGLSQLNHGSNNDSSNSSAGSNVASAPRAQTNGTVERIRVLVTGTRYTTAELGPQARALVALTPATAPPSVEAAPASPSTVPGTTFDSRDSGAVPAPSAAPTSQAPPGLQRLSEPDALMVCLTTLKVSSPYAVDYATFDGRAAVVIVTPAATARDLVVYVVGPSCGLNGEADLLSRTTVGS